MNPETLTTSCLSKGPWSQICGW